jgi:hypothetical protein
MICVSASPVETLRRKIRCASRRVEEEGKVGGIVQRQIGWLERLKVRKIDPVPRREQHILGGNVAVSDAP